MVADLEAHHAKFALFSNHTALLRVSPRFSASSRRAMETAKLAGPGMWKRKSARRSKRCNDLKQLTVSDADEVVHLFRLGSSHAARRGGGVPVHVHDELFSKWQSCSCIGMLVRSCAFV